MQEIEHSLRHHRRSTEVVFDIFGSIVLLEVCITHNRSDETWSILDAEAISLGVWTVERQVEVEVGEFLFQSEEVFEEEYFVDSTCTIEEL